MRGGAGVDVGLAVGVGEGATVGVAVGVEVAVGVGEGVDVGVTVAVAVGVGEGVGVGARAEVYVSCPVQPRTKVPKTVELPDPGTIRLKNKLLAGTASSEGFQVWKLMPPEFGPPGWNDA